MVKKPMRRSCYLTGTVVITVCLSEMVLALTPSGDTVWMWTDQVTKA